MSYHIWLQVKKQYEQINTYVVSNIYNDMSRLLIIIYKRPHPDTLKMYRKNVSVSALQLVFLETLQRVLTH